MQLIGGKFGNLLDYEIWMDYNDSADHEGSAPAVVEIGARVVSERLRS